MTRYLKHARLLAGALALVVGLTLAAPPAFAAEPAPDPAPDRRRRDRQGRGHARGQRSPRPPRPHPATAAAPRPGASPSSRPTKGAIALVLLAGALGYMVYSCHNDRVKSPAK